MQTIKDLYADSKDAPSCRVWLSLLMLFIFFGRSAYGQESFSIQEMHSLANFGSGLKSYIHAPPTRCGSSASSPIFESSLTHRFQMLNRADYKYQYTDLDFSMNITLRMYDEISSPIYPLNFEPGIRYVHYSRKPKPSSFHYYTLELKHLSNGQSGSFYIPGTDIINLESGDFSTNFVIGKYTYVKRLKKFILMQSYGARIDWGIPTTVFAIQDKMLKSYGRYRLIVNYQLISSSFTLFPRWEDALGTFRLVTRVENTYIAGDLSNYPGPNNNRYSFNARMILYPEKDLFFAPFLNYYSGRDSYNLRYTDHVNTWTMGLMFNLPEL